MIKSWSSVQQNVEVIIGSSVPSLDAWAWVRIPCHHQSPRLVDLSASVWSFFLRKAKYCCTWFISYFTLATSTKLHTSVMVFKCSKCTRGKSISEPHSTDFVIGKFCPFANQLANRRIQWIPGPTCAVNAYKYLIRRSVMRQKPGVNW